MASVKGDITMNDTNNTIFDDENLDIDVNDMDFDFIEEDEELDNEENSSINEESNFDEVFSSIGNDESEETSQGDVEEDYTTFENYEQINTEDDEDFDFYNNSTKTTYDIEDASNEVAFNTEFSNDDDEDGNRYENEDTEFDFDDAGADIDGTDISLKDAGFEVDTNNYVGIDSENSSFINIDGEIQVMERSNDENTFEIRYIDIDKISIAANRIRKSINVEELVMSVQNNGLLEPLVVAPTQTEGIYVLVAGFRRVLACAKAGIRKVPCIVNNKIRTLEIPIIEALYNHNKQYTMREIIDYIDYLEREKGIASASMIEHLLMLDNGDYAKLKDILEDDDPDIVQKLLDGQATIAQSFKALEQKRKKQSREEKDLKKAAKVYGNAEETGASEMADSGESADENVALSDDEIKELTSGATDFDGADDTDLQTLVDESNDMSGYHYDKQTPGAREGIDPAIRKAVLTRDNGRCIICGFGGPGLESIIDIHHILGVQQGQDDNPDNCCSLCITDHMAVESWAYGKLPITGIDNMTEEEQKRMKRIIKLGNVKRNYMVKLGMKREQIKEAGKEGTKLRRMPGASQPRA